MLWADSVVIMGCWRDEWAVVEARGEGRGVVGMGTGVDLIWKRVWEFVLGGGGGGVYGVNLAAVVIEGWVW